MRRGGLMYSLLFIVLLLSIGDGGSGQTAANFSRDDFPPDFVFGAGTSAYQVEGAAAEDGRTPSVWDTFTHSGKMLDKSTGDVAADGYHKYKEDVKLMTDTALEAYRFSISWSRLLPYGRGYVNPKGLEFYNNLINELIENGIQPHVTLCHLDPPQVLEDEYGGWLSPKIVDDFTAYADVCFREFGDRISHWTTIAEPNVIGTASYDSGMWPPNRCSYPFGFNCTAGNSTTEPYISGHNIMLAHASIATLYRNKYQAVQNGWIGINIYSYWGYPFSNSTADVEAAQRSLDFGVGWILNPLVFGDYPQVMKQNVGSRLPSFTKHQTKQIKGSFDFIGLNHYTSAYIKDDGRPKPSLRDYNADMSVQVSGSRNETPSGQFVPIYNTVDPAGLQHMLEYIKEAYGNPPVYIQENGYGVGLNDTFNDTARIDYISGFIGSTLQAFRSGSNVRGYFVWSFMDLFEFLSGYTSSCGLYNVDFEDEQLRRQPKLSAFWYSDFLKKKNSIRMTNLHSTSYAQK